MPHLEGNAVAHGATLRKGYLEVCKVFAHRPGLLQVGSPGQEGWGRVPKACGLNLLEGLHHIQGDICKVQLLVILQLRDVALRVTAFLDGQTQAAAQLGNQGGLHGQACRLGVSAEAQKQILAGGEHGVYVDTRDGAAAAGGNAVRNGKYDGGVVVLLADSAGSEADNALVPALPGEDNGVVVTEIHLLGDAFQGFLGDFLL